MKTIKQILLVLMLTCIGALTSVHAELITADTSGASGTLLYSTGDFGFEELNYSSYSFTAWYDTETGCGHYIYTCSGSIDVTVELACEGGTWSRVSYYGEAAAPDFAIGFWSQL